MIWIFGKICSDEASTYFVTAFLKIQFTYFSEYVTVTKDKLKAKLRKSRLRS